MPSCRGISDFLTVVVFALFILAAVSSDGQVTRLLNATPLLWLGEVSYSLYLAHGLVQFGATRLLNAEGLADRGTLSQLSSLLLIGATRLRRLFGLAKPKPKMAVG